MINKIRFLAVLILFSLKFQGQCTGTYGTVVISEIYFDTYYAEDIEARFHSFGEYIELFNSSDQDINLEGWVLKDNHTTFKFSTSDGMDNNLIIGPGKHKIIAYNGFYATNGQFGMPSAIGGRNKFRELFPLPDIDDPDSEIILQNSIVLYNETDKISLYTPQGKLVDEISYSNLSGDVSFNPNPIDYMELQSSDYTITISPRINNGNGGWYNGAIGAIEIFSFDPFNPLPIFDPFLTTIIYTNRNKKVVYRSNQSDFYSDGGDFFQVGIATPLGFPQGLAVPTLPIDPLLFYQPQSDDNNNLSESYTYDIKTGLLDGFSKMYFDDFGRPTVSMTQDFNNQGLVWGSEIMYDSFGRKSKESFPSAICVPMTKVDFLSNPIIKANILDKYYSNNNTLEPYQATAEQSFTEINYDKLNPGNIINFYGGNKVQTSSSTSDWKTGFSFTIPAAQEMYYAFGSDYFNDERNPLYYLADFEDKSYPSYDGLGVTSYWLKILNSDADIVPLTSFPITLPIGGFYEVKANSPLEIGKIYRALYSGNTYYFQVLREPLGFRNNIVPQLPAQVEIISGSWQTYSEAIGYNESLGFDGLITTILQSNDNIIAGLKCVKTVLIDANGVENVIFIDTDGKTLASAKSGDYSNNNQYPVRSLIGKQGFIDIHLPMGCESTLSYIGGSMLYNVYNLKTGTILSLSEMSNMSPGVYRVELKANSVPLQLNYIDKVNGTVHDVSPNSRGVEYNVNYYDYSLNIYNDVGQLTKTIQPKGYEENYSIIPVPTHMTSAAFSSTFTYNNQDQLKSTTNIDQGQSRIAYKRNGQIRYAQTQIQADNKVSYINYDSLGRTTEGGILTLNTTGIWALAELSVDNSSLLLNPNIYKSEQVFTIYDYPDNNETTLSSAFFSSLPSLPSNYVQKNLSGNVALTIKADTTNNIFNSITWYSYDAYGRMEWVVQYNPDLSFKTIDYVYDYKGNTEQIIYQKNSSTEKFTHKYSYDINNNIVQVETAANNNPFTIDASYTYYKSGELKRTNIAQGGQGLDYVYTLGGMLKSINHPSLDQTKDPGHDSNDLFGLTLDYYPGDYKRETSSNGINDFETHISTGFDYNGNIKAARWANKAIDFDSATNTIIPKAYKYSYNRNNWLSEARFGTSTLSGAITTAIAPNLGIHYEGNLDYDENGNIQSLKRTDSFGTLVDNLAYSYGNGNNQLITVNDQSTYTTATDQSDLEGLNNYQYNTIGQLEYDLQNNLHYFYTATGLVDKITKGTNIVVQYYYNERGQRIKKDSYNTNTFAYIGSDYYVYDLTGNLISIYNSSALNPNVVQTELPIYGASRLGIYFKGSPDIRKYEITDHLGNVRAVMEYNNSQSQYGIGSYADYYPFGEKLTNRNYWNYYRFLFQGQELDSETGMENFSLRQWDGRIGRWLTIDPYGQFHSPYLGMGNNPINGIDRDGGFWEELGNFIFGNGWKKNSELSILFPELNDAGFGNGFKDGYNELTFSIDKGFNEFLAHPGDFVGEAAVNLLKGGQQLVGDTGLAIFGIENKTYRGLANGLYSIPDMTGYDFGRATITGTTTAATVYLTGRVNIPVIKSSNITGFRYMTEGELKAIQRTGMLRGGTPGPTFFTKDLYKSAAHAQERLSLPTRPTLRVEFKIINNPKMLRNGTKVFPDFTFSGGGAEFLTTDPVFVELINWQPLR